MSSGPSLPSNPAPAYQYANSAGADQGAYGGATSLTNNPAQNYPQFQTVANDVTSGAYGGKQITQAGQQQIGAANSLVPYATQALQQGFNPQNAEYNQQFQQNQQQTNANNATQGVGGTPYGAAVTNNADTNFNLAWQQQQLANQAQGASTASGLLNTSGQGATTGANLLTGVPNESLSALTTLNNAGVAGTGIQQMSVQDLLSYLTGGTSAANAGTSQYGAEANASLGQQGINNQQLAGLGSLGINLASLFTPKAANN